MRLNRKKTYYKVLNAAENHNGYQYHDGLNIDPVPFNSDPEASCVPGGFYFTDLDHIGDFFCYGAHCREVTVPKNARVVKDPDGDKWRADKLVLGRRLTILAVCAMLPKDYPGTLDLSSVTSAKGLTLPQTVRGSLDLSSVTSAEGLTLPQTVGGTLDLYRLRSAKGLTLPQTVGGSLHLDNLRSAKGLTLPQTV